MTSHHRHGCLYLQRLQLEVRHEERLQPLHLHQPCRAQSLPEPGELEMYPYML
jgi:hypothetical protein